MNCIIAYSGGLDTSAAIVWLKKVKKASHVAAILIDVGQKEDLSSHAERALELGADHVRVMDCKEKLCNQGIAPLLKALAKYETQYLLGTAVARPIIAEAIMNAAEELGADSVCHGATGKGNDYLRFEQRMLAINSKIQIVSPWREWQFGGREEALEFLKASGQKFPQSTFTYSQDANLWHTSYEGGNLENIELPLPSELQERMMKKGSARIRVDWKNGIPVALQGIQMPLHLLIAELNHLLEATGYGWVDLVETRTNGLKSRGIYYTPAGSLLMSGQLTLAQLFFSGPTLQWLQESSYTYAKLIYEGHWNHPVLKALNAGISSLYEETHGSVEFLVEGSQLVIQKREANPSKFSSALSGFETMKTWSSTLSESLVSIQQLKWNSIPFGVVQKGNLQ